MDSITVLDFEEIIKGEGLTVVDFSNIYKKF